MAVAVARPIVALIDDAVQVADALAQGDLKTQFHTGGTNEISRLMIALTHKSVI
jgi:methyl-accepting chemotaxis protein